MNESQKAPVLRAWSSGSATERWLDHEDELHQRTKPLTDSPFDRIIGKWWNREMKHGLKEVGLWLGWACQARWQASGPTEPVWLACILSSDPWWATLLYHVLPTWCSALSMLPRSIIVSDHGLKPWNKISLTSSLFFSFFEIGSPSSLCWSVTCYVYQVDLKLKEM